MKTPVIHNATELIYPDSISQERISFLINVKGIAPEVAELDFELLKLKLQDQEEGMGWSAQQVDSAEIEYKRYLNLCLKYGKGIVPNKIMDQTWHYHILDTRTYHQDCDKLFGGYMHHYPYFGMRGEQDAQDLKDSFENTKDLYLELFDEEMARDEHNKCWHDCENRCWNACPSKSAE